MDAIPDWVFDGTLSLPDRRVADAIASVGGFHDSYLTTARLGPDQLFLRFDAPYFPQERRYGLFRIKAAELCVAISPNTDHGELDALTGILDFEVYYVDLDVVAGTLHLNIDIFYDLELAIIPEKSRFSWVFKP